MKIISVVIPSYNRERFIIDSLESVLNQRLPNEWKMEVIIADDGSTDNTLSLLKKYIDKGQVIFYQLEHSGKPAVPRNYAIKKSKGELIAFQDSDDIWAQNKLIKQINLFKNSNTVLTYSNAEKVSSTGKKMNQLVVENSKIKDGEKFNKLLQDNVISTLTVVVRKEIFKKVGFFGEQDDLRGVEDYDLWLRISSLYAGRIKCLPDKLAYYRVHDKNISIASNTLAISRIINVLSNISTLKSLTNKQLEQVQDELREKNITLSMHLNEENNERSPLLSVIMSVYNGGDYLKPAIESILTQSFRDFEFIIIDDGSTDDSAKIIASYKDPRIRLIVQQNSGLVKSLNLGIRIARANIIARMDADDISLPDRLKKEIEWIRLNKKNGLVSTYFSHLNFDEKKPNGTNIVFPINDIDLKRLMYVTNPIAHGASMFRKEAVMEAGLYSNNFGPTEDYELWTRISKKWNIGLVPEILYWYRINNSQSISQKNIKKQNYFINKIREGLWGEAFIEKSPYRIFDDFIKMKLQIPNQYLSQATSNYKNLQYDLTMQLITRKQLRRCYRQLIGLLIVFPGGFLRVLKYLPGLHWAVLKNKMKRVYSL